MKLTTMTITKCAECPFKSDYCKHPKNHWIIKCSKINIPERCPVAFGKPFSISFTPINESNEKDS